MKYKVLFLIDYYGKNYGASAALTDLIENDINLIDYLVISSSVRDIPKNFKIKKVSNSKEIIEILNSQSFDFIHYFKASTINLFDITVKAIKKLKKQIPIITTICQQPNIKNLYLTSKEIKNSDILVFIDKTAFKCSILSFIKSKQKRQTYIGCTESLIQETKDILNTYNFIPKEKIVFGRGSTANKCHKDFIKVFNDIRIKNKEFEIIGIDNPSIFNVNQDNIIFRGQLPKHEWLEKCNTFDIFLYVLPENAHSSIDGTLAHAMLLEKPVVYFGPDAPKERIKNGENGFIANSVSEVAPICEYIVRNPEKAKLIGHNARNSTIKDFHFDSTLKDYHIFYQDLMTQMDSINKINIPLKYRYLYIINNLRTIIKKQYRKVFKPV